MFLIIEIVRNVKEHKRICQLCGQTFVGKSPAKYCPECAKNKRRQRLCVLVLSLVLLLSIAACGNNDNTSTSKSSVSNNPAMPPAESSVPSQSSSVSSSTAKSVSGNISSTTQDTQGTVMNFTEIQAGNYSSLLGTWTGVACAENRHDGTGEQWKAVSVYSLSVSSDKIKYGNGKLVIQGNILKDSAGSHTLSFENNRGSLDVSLTDADATINWAVYFYPKGVTNDIQPNNGVKIDNTKNLIIIWTSNNDFTEVFAQTDAKPCSKTSVLPSKDNNKKVADTPKSTSAEKVKKLDSSFGEWSISSFLGRTNVSTYEENENEIIGEKISLYSNEASIGDETIDDPVFTTKEYSYDDALEDRFNPTFYDLKPGSFCLTVDVTSKTNKNFGLSYSILNDSDEIVIFTNSRFYKAQRATTSPAITEQVSP